MKLPEANSDFALYVVLDGGADAALVSVRPIEAGRTIRATLKGTCNPGDVLVLADIGTAADKGKVPESLVDRLQCPSIRLGISISGTA